MMTFVLAVLLFAVTVKCVANKVSVLALLLYMQDHGVVPSQAEIESYAKKTAKKLFHMPSC